MLRLTFNSMPRKSPVMIAHEVFARNDGDFSATISDWRYAVLFSEACKKDGGNPQEVISAAESRVYCEKAGFAYWEFLEGYADVRPAYKGPPLNREYMVLYRTIATAPLTD